MSQTLLEMIEDGYLHTYELDYKEGMLGLNVQVRAQTKREAFNIIKDHMTEENEKQIERGTIVVFFYPDELKIDMIDEVD